MKAKNRNDYEDKQNTEIIKKKRQKKKKIPKC